MPSDPIILVSSYDSITTITLNRPEKRNAMNRIMIQELTETLIQLAKDDATNVLILCANGDHFCAGADIASMQELAHASTDENTHDAMQLANLMYLLYTFPKPVIVLAHGAVMGGGLGLIAASDIAIIATNTSFSFSEVKLGIAPSVISPYIIAAVGERIARYYFLTAERFGAEKAEHIGLVHKIVEQEALAIVGLTVARELLQFSKVTLSEIKNLVRRVSSHDISPELVQFTAQHLAGMRATSDAIEGLQAFLEKRKPNWS